MLIAMEHGITQFRQGIDEDWWNILGQKFKHTLEVRMFHHHSVLSTSVSMPSTIFYEFQNAPHPDIMDVTFPCPSEWKFSDGERVVAIQPSEKQGIIKAMRSCSAEVDLEAGDGIVNVPWSKLRKYVVISDFAEVISRTLCGEKGWVVEINGDAIVWITEWLERQDIRGSIMAVGRGGVHGGVHHNILTVGKLLQPTANQPLPGTPSPYKLGQSYCPTTHIYKATVYVK